MAQSSYIEEVYKSRKNLLEILNEQGYDISAHNNPSMIEVNAMVVNKQLDMLLENKKNGKKCYVRYNLGKNLRPTNLHGMIEELFHLEEIIDKKDDLIIITSDEPNEPLIKNISNIWEQDGIFISVMNIKRLQFNVLKHELVPKHRILSDEETIEFKKKFGIVNNNQIPDISRFGPVSIAIGIRPGQICEITRSSKTAIKSNFYRICS